MNRLDQKTRDTTARTARKAERQASPRTGDGARPRGAFVELEFKDGDKRITYTGHKTRAIPLFGMTGLTEAQRAAGVLYGAMAEELAGGGIRCVSIEAMPSGSGGAGPEGAVDRRLIMRGRVQIAQKGLALLHPMKPMRAARKAKGGADLGKVHRSESPAGNIVELRQPITARALVDAVCIGGSDMASVLRSHGWTVCGRTKVQANELLAKSLAAILYLWGDETRGTGSKMQSYHVS
ncbi:MAG: hypothetical protein COA84_15155 [Robiginitomaculum sp.]|nr:MAG: hypothetical protein COA84_15155 [Robiginitomaculum sp.]